jgi:hypothetical protein
MRFECSSVSALDYGADIFGGSARRRELKPWLRTPIWQAQEEGPASNHDVALHLDFEDEAGFDAYNEDATHGHVGAYNASVNFGEFTARVNYWYDGPPSINPGHVRLCSLFLWAPGASDADRERATGAMRGLESVPGVERVTIGDNVPLLRTDYDWIVDLQVADRDAAERLLGGSEYGQTLEALIPATRYEWTARVAHVMRGL